MCHRVKLQRKKERQADVVGKYIMEREQREVVGTDRERERETGGCWMVVGSIGRQTDWTDRF